MRSRSRSTFVLSTRGCCLLCMRQVRSRNFSPNFDGDSNSSVSVFSLYEICRYLKIDVENLLVTLCQICGELMGKVSRLFRLQERVELELSHYLEMVHAVLEETEADPELVGSYQELIKDDGNAVLHSEIATELKRKIVENGKTKILKQKPTIALLKDPEVDRMALHYQKQLHRPVPVSSSASQNEDNDAGINATCRPDLLSLSPPDKPNCPEESNKTVKTVEKPPVPVVVLDSDSESELELRKEDEKMKPPQLELDYVAEEVIEIDEEVTKIEPLPVPVPESAYPEVLMGNRLNSTSGPGPLYPDVVENHSSNVKPYFEDDEQLEIDVAYNHLEDTDISFSQDPLSEASVSSDYANTVSGNPFGSDSSSHGNSIGHPNIPISSPPDFNLEPSDFHTFTPSTGQGSRTTKKKSWKKQAEVEVAPLILENGEGEIISCQCPLCNRSYNDIFAYKKHFRNIHMKIRHKCDGCGMTFAQRGYLRQHRFICGSKTRRSAYDTASTPAAPGPRFKCDICGGHFLERSSLGIHRRTIHFQERKWPCDLCGKRFTQSGALGRHKKEVHEDPNNKRFKCTVPGCPKAFTRNFGLKLHLKGEHGTLGGEESID